MRTQPKGMYTHSPIFSPYFFVLFIVEDCGNHNSMMHPLSDKGTIEINGTFSWKFTPLTLDFLFFFQTGPTGVYMRVLQLCQTCFQQCHSPRYFLIWIHRKHQRQHAFKTVCDEAFKMLHYLNTDASYDVNDVQSSAHRKIYYIHCTTIWQSCLSIWIILINYFLLC